MRFKPAFLLSSAVLLAALPVWADSVSYPLSSSKLANDGPAGFSRELNASEPLIYNSEASATNTWDSISAIAPYEFLVSPRDIRPTTLNGLPTNGITSSIADFREALWAHREEGEYAVLSLARHHDHNPHSHAERVPEPGSLPLVFVGLAAIGLVSLRRSRMA
jgi:hypothetical protein